MSGELKKLLQQKCVESIEQRMVNANEAIEMARQSANEEGKSSAGDKHETGRAMAQLEQEKAGKQLSELQTQLGILKRLNSEIVSTAVGLGSLVNTNSGHFYLAVAVGKIRVADNDYFAVSVNSPVGIALLGKKVGDEVMVNGKAIRIDLIQ